MKNKTTRLLGIGLLLFTLLSPLIPAQSASALDSSSTVQTQLYSYESYAFISSVQGQTCADDWAGDITPNDANDRNWFTSTVGQQWRSGQILSPGDGTLSCNNGGDWIDNALDTWGWGGNGGTFLCAIGFTQKPSPSVGLTPGCKSAGNGDGGFHNDGVSPGSTGTAIKNKAYGGKEPIMTPAMRYLLYYRSFIDGCQASQQKVWSAATSEEQNGDKAYRIPFVASNGTVTDYLFAAEKGKAANVTMGANDEKGVDELTCGELATRLQNNTANVRAFADAVKANPANAQSLTTSSATNGNSATNAPVDCGSDALNWIVCPLIKLGLKATAALDGFIMSQLDTNSDAIFGDTNGKNTSQDNVSSGGYYTAWNSFRILATAIIVIAGLVMVASQAFGFEFLDAYTIRKTLPRLLIAIIGISLSWPLMQFMVNFFNTVGFDIRNLLYAPFDRPGATISVSTGILTTLGAGAALFVMGPAALTFIITAVLATIVGFLILVIRQIAIIALIVLAPIGIACYVLPNTQKIWKLWSDNFMGLMLMFPIISALIAAGHIFSAVTVQGHTGNSPADIAAQGLALVAYVLPYFLLPMAARLATGIIGTLAGLVNDRGKGVFDRLKKTRQNAAATRMNDLANYNRFAGGTDTNFRGKINRSLGRTANVAQGGYNPAQWKNRMSAYESTHSFDHALEALEKNSDVRAFKDNDTLVSAAMEGRGTDSDIRTYLRANTNWDAATIEQSVGQIRRARRSVGDETWSTLLPLAQAGTGTGQADAGEMLDQIARFSHGNRPLAQRMAFAARSIAKGAGREDLGSFGATPMLQQLEVAMQGGHANGRELTLDALRSIDSVTAVRQRDVGLSNMTDAATDRIQELHNTVARTADQDRELGRLTAILENLKTTGGMYAAPERVETLTDATYHTSRERGQIHAVTEAAPPPTYDIQTGLRNRSDERAEGYREQHQARGYNPDDPFNQP